jgi:arylsulfatase A-like enzyme
MNPNDAGITDFFDSPERRRAKLSGYYGSITAVDEDVGRLLHWLDVHGLRENTLILFTSDNGMNMGHHGICGKGNGTLPVNLFDTSCKVPAVFSRPGHLPEGRLFDGLYSHVDWRTTLLDYVGIEDPEAEGLPGRSYADLLRGQEDEGDEAVVVYDEYGPVRMIRTREWKYVHRYAEDQSHELYDLVNDPHERENLIGNPEHAALVAKMRRRLQEWFDRYALPEYDGSKLPVTGCGQVRRANEPDAFAQQWPDSWLHKR